MFKTTPFKHQLECLNRFAGHNYYALLAEMGTGKTWIVINDFAQLFEQCVLDGVLIFAPNGVHSNWVLNELPKHMPDNVKWRAHLWRANLTKTEKQKIECFFVKNNDLRIMAMNHESLQNAKGFAMAERFCKSCENLMVVLDESDGFKNPQALRVKNLFKLKKYARFRRIMSGTPVNNSPFDLFAPFKFLNDGILGTTSFHAFKAEYAELLKEGNPLLNAIKTRAGARFTPQVVAKDSHGRPKYRNLDKLSNLIAPYSFRITRAECVDLPPKVYKTLYFDLTAEQKRAYDLAENEGRFVFEGDNVAVFQALTIIQKLAQITSGYCLVNGIDEPQRIAGKNPKLDLLIERVAKFADEGKNIIIWARFRVEIADIAERLRQAGVSFVEYHGGIAQKQREENIVAFESRKCNVFLANQQAAGTGLNLVSASVVFYFSNDFSLRNRLQSEDRAHRIGQTQSVTYYNIVAKGTIDEVVTRVLQSKKSVADAIVEHGLGFFKLK